jgi:hypothetical protein
MFDSSFDEFEEGTARKALFEDSPDLIESTGQSMSLPQIAGAILAGTAMVGFVFLVCGLFFGGSPDQSSVSEWHAPAGSHAAQPDFRRYPSPARSTLPDSNSRASDAKSEPSFAPHRSAGADPAPQVTGLFLGATEPPLHSDPRGKLLAGVVVLLSLLLFTVVFRRIINRLLVIGFFILLAIIVLSGVF